jgi:phosphonate transport system substrate-binding protein
MRRLLVLVTALLSFTSFAQGAVLVGVVASLNDEVAKKQADAFAAFVGRALKEQALPKVYADQEALAQAVAKNEVDFALLGPLGYLRLDPKAKAQLLFRTIRHGKGTYRSVLFAPSNTKYGTLDALKKAKTPLKVAWVETSSATGYVIAKASLLEQGINPAQAFETQDFLGSHDAVCKAVLEGKYDFGATFSDPAPNAAKVTGCTGPLGKKADSLKVVVMSSEVPNDVVVASGKLSPGKAQALVAAAKEASASAEGKKSLEAALLAEGVADVKDEDFKPVRKALDAFVP